MYTTTNFSVKSYNSNAVIFFHESENNTIDLNIDTTQFEVGDEEGMFYYIQEQLLLNEEMFKEELLDIIDYVFIGINLRGE